MTPEERRDAMRELKITIIQCGSCRNDVVVRDGIQPLHCPACRRALNAKPTGKRLGRPPKPDPRRQAPPHGHGQEPI